MYSLIYSKKFQKQIKKLDKSLQKRIIQNLERCRIRPHNHIKRIVGTASFRLRTGDYRIILDIKNDKLIILVLELGHRKNIYKNY